IGRHALARARCVAEVALHRTGHRARARAGRRGRVEARRVLPACRSGGGSGWHADLDGTRARAAMAIVGAEAHPVNTPTAASHSFRAEIGVRRPDAPPIGATPVAPAVE